MKPRPSIYIQPPLSKNILRMDRHAEWDVSVLFPAQLIQQTIDEFSGRHLQAFTKLKVKIKTSCCGPIAESWDFRNHHKAKASLIENKNDGGWFLFQYRSRLY